MGEIGQQIARFLSAIDWYGIILRAAYAIGAAINAAFAMIRGFIDELHWDDIATQIYTAMLSGHDCDSDFVYVTNQNDLVTF